MTAEIDIGRIRKALTECGREYQTLSRLLAISSELQPDDPIPSDVILNAVRDCNRRGDREFARTLLQYLSHSTGLTISLGDEMPPKTGDRT